MSNLSKARPLIDATAIHAELRRTADRPFPIADLVRAAALVSEEAGELLKEALDATRAPSGISDARWKALYTEACHTATVALRFMVELRLNRDQLVTYIESDFPLTEPIGEDVDD